MKSKQQGGFTLIELLLTFWFLFLLSLIGSAIYVAVHFIAKFW
jgi:type II secretory pathway component PulJ